MYQELKDDLADADTLNEMWDTLDEWYDLDTPLSKITKKLVVMAFIKKFDKILMVTRIPERPLPDDDENEEEENTN